MTPRVYTDVAYAERLRQAVEAEWVGLDRAEAAVLAADLDDRVLRAPHVTWVHCDHAGLERSARPEVFDRGLVVTGSAGRSAPALAEHAIFFMLSLAYDAPAFLDAQRARRWGVPGQEKLRALYGRTAGIVGLGHTGTELASRARAFGMRVLACRRRPDPACVPLETVLRESDFVVLALPLSDRTWRMIGARELALMKPAAFLVNMARGAIVDESALVAALRSGRLAGAALDVFEREPLPADSPLWSAPRTLITPHVTPQVPDRTARSLEIIAENFRRWRAGEPLLNRLTRDDVYTRG